MTTVRSDDPTVALHRNSRTVAPRPRPADQYTVGDRLRGGALSGGVRDVSIWVNCAVLGAGVTVDIGPAQAEAFAAHLAEWARRARAALSDPPTNPFS